jgi:superfamily II DNA helicase RecQ
MASLSERQNEVVRTMLAEELNLISPRPFQVDVIREAVFPSQAGPPHILMVQKTGEGKSAVIMGALLMLRGLALIIVPLLSIGTGQASAATKLCRSVDSYHVDELSLEERQVLFKRLQNTTDTSGRPVLLFVSPQALDVKDFRVIISGLIERSVLTIVGVDEEARRLI